MIKLHRRQYILAPEPILPDSSWHTRDVGTGYVLSHSAELPTATISVAGSGPWHLLGAAVPTAQPHHDDVLIRLAAGSPTELTSAYQAWTGRWLLIGPDEVHTDACAMLGCYYFIDSRGRVAMSSSAALLAQCYLHLEGRPPTVGEPLERRKGMDWYPLPVSGYKEFRRLMPSQVLRYRTPARIAPRQLLPPAASSESDSVRLDRAANRLVASMHNLCKGSSPPWLSLTGGYDTRLLLAACLSAGVPVRAFTQEHEGMTLADRRLPVEFARRYGFKHIFIRPGVPSQDRLRAFDEHTAGQTVDMDRTFYARGQWEHPFESGDRALRGGVLAMAIAFYHDKFRHIDLAPGAGSQIVGTYRNATAEQAARLEPWIEWAAQHPVTDLDWRDRFYLEVRDGGWLSAIEQGLDIVGIESLHPANCAALIADLVHTPASMRSNHEVHIELIRRLLPDLNRDPFNAPDPFWYRILRKIRGMRRPRPTN